MPDELESGALSDRSNYRPITTLSPFSKALKRVIYDRLVKYLDKHNVLGEKKPFHWASDYEAHW